MLNFLLPGKEKPFWCVFPTRGLSAQKGKRKKKFPRPTTNNNVAPDFTSQY